MREEKEPVTIFEEMYDGLSRYSKDFKHAYSIPEDCEYYSLRDGCTSLELKGGASMCTELVLPTSFDSFYLESIVCLPYLKKITAYSEFFFVSERGLNEPIVTSFWKDSRLEEICVLPWLVDKYNKAFGYWPGISDAIIKVTAIHDDIAYRLTAKQDNGITTSKNGKTLIKVDNDIRVLEIPIAIERVASTAFGEGNQIEKVVIKGDCEDYHKDRGSLDFEKDAVNSLKSVETLVFEGPMHTSFYDNYLTGAKMPGLKTIIYPLWNYSHFCFRGSEAEVSDIHPYEIKAKNFSNIELIEENGIIYSKDGKYLVSGVDCTSKSVHIRNGVKEIFQYAFCCNTSIEEIYIPHTVEKLGSCAFKSCQNIRKIVFNFEQIMSKDAETAFCTFSSKMDVYLPASDFSEALCEHFDNISIHTLPNCKGEVSIDEETKYVYDISGQLFMGVIEEIAKEIHRVTLPDTIIEIDKNAFTTLHSLEEIIVPESISVRDVYQLAENCPKLQKIISGKQTLSIEGGIVYINGYKEILKVSKDEKVISFICKNGVETIHPSAFENHKELIKIQLPQTIKTIGDKAFANTGLSDVTFPASLQELGKDVFLSCALALVIFDGKAPIGPHAFNGVIFTPSANFVVPQIYRDDFIKTFPTIKKLIKTPLPKWLSWLR